MAALAINFLALLIVLGLCWGAMMWLSGRFHGQRAHGEFTAMYRDHDGSAPSERQHDAQTSGMSPETPCTVCEGVGAQNSQGQLALCPACYGTGVLSQ